MGKSAACQQMLIPFMIEHEQQRSTSLLHLPLVRIRGLCSEYTLQGLNAAGLRTNITGDGLQESRVTQLTAFVRRQADTYGAETENVLSQSIHSRGRTPLNSPWH